MRCALVVSALALARGAPVPLIIDTDLGFDVDDVGAIAVANYLADRGECEIIAIAHNTAFYEGIGGVDTIVNWYGRHGALELGAYTGPWGSAGGQDRYTTAIEADWPAPVRNYNDTQSAVAAYAAALPRRTARSSSRRSASSRTCATRSRRCPSSSRRRCGRSTTWTGRTTSAAATRPGAVEPVARLDRGLRRRRAGRVARVPATIKQVFSGEGGDICTGGRFNEGCGDGPVKEAYQIWTDGGCRWSWDPITVYLAVMGDESLYSYTEAGTNTVDYYGGESFDTGDTGNNMFRVYINDDNKGDVVRVLDDALCAAPLRS